MIYDDKVVWREKALSEGLLIRTLKMLNIGSVTNKLQPYGLSPMAGLPMSQRTVSRHMGFEGGTGICVSHATRYYGKPGTLFRRKLRINKCPWVSGQEDLRLRITISFGHTVGNNGAGAPAKVYLRKWFRDNEQPFEETFMSGTAPATQFMKDMGYQDAHGTIKVRLEPRDANPEAGHPYVWDSENGMSETYVGCFWSDATFSQGISFMNYRGDGPYIHYFPLPCPQWTMHRLNFSEGFTSTYYKPGAMFGIVQGVGATIEAIGWDTGWHDVEGWHAGTDADPYSIPRPNSYQYPNYPVDNPFNPIGEGVG